MGSLLLLLLSCVATIQAVEKDLAVTDLVVETTTSAANSIDNSTCFCYLFLVPMYVSML